MEYQYTTKQPEIVAPTKKYYRERKYWVRAARKKNNQHMQITNECTEYEYHKLIKEIKKLLAPQQEYVFERDYKQNSDSLLTMHVFQCKTMCIELWCCFSEFYFVDFYFHNCAYEQQIRYHLERGMLHTQSRHFPLDPGFFERTRQREDEKFFYHLKADTSQADT